MKLSLYKNLCHLTIFISMLGLYFINPSGHQFDSFDSIFEKEKEILIKTNNLKVGQLYIMKTDFYNNLLFLDARGCQLLVFNQEGKFLKRIGKKGQGPGEFSMPFGLGVDSKGNIILSDGQSRRINKYDREGNFISSFICSGMHWPPHIICIDSEDNYFFGGFKANLQKLNFGEGMYINKYSPKGKYLKSFYSRNTNQLWFLSLYPFFGFDMDEEDKIYAIQMNEYKISVFDSEGNLIETLGKTPAYFKKPDPSLRVGYSRFRDQSKLREKLTKLSKSWTKILLIKVIKDEYILLELEMNNLIERFNKKYVLDLWSKKGKFLAGGIQTDYKFLCTDKDGYVYFLIYTDEEEVTEKEPEYVIGKFKLILGEK